MCLREARHLRSGTRWQSHGTIVRRTFCGQLEEIIDLGHPLVQLAREIDLGFLDRRFAAVCTPGAGQPPLHEVLRARWLEDLYYQFFCGKEELVAMLRESLLMAHKTGALATRDLERVVVDTTIQPKAIAHPTGARLCHRAREKLV